MREYDEIREYVRNLRNHYEYLDATDLYDVATEILDSFDDYDNEIDDTKKKDLLELINVYIDKYENLEKIYDKLNYAATTHPPDYSYYVTFDEDNPRATDRSIIEELLERVHLNSGLRRRDNEVHAILRETLGWYFSEMDVIELLRSFFLKNASNEILDEYAYQYGVLRENNESDDSLRSRILAHIKESYRVPDVKQSCIELFTYVDNPYTQLTSKNTYLSRKYLAHGTNTMMDYWDGKYMTWRDITWF